jgi:uncharacterized protein with GYD domain
MARYMTLFGITPAAWAELAPAAADRGRALGARLAPLGVRVLDLTQAFGGVYDGMALYEAPDQAAAEAAAAALGALGPGTAARTLLLHPGEWPREARVRLATAGGAGA